MFVTLNAFLGVLFINLKSGKHGIQYILIYWYGVFAYLDSFELVVFWNQFEPRVFTDLVNRVSGLWICVENFGK